MFCLGCGAETPPRATRCPVCGREVRGATGEVQWTVSPTASSSAAPIPAPRNPLSNLFESARLTARAPSIEAGDLDTPGFPRDAYGRALLIAAIAMAADLLVPWIDQFGTRVAPAQLGLPILVVVAILALTLVPLLRPSFRARPSLAAIPVVAGGMLLSPTLVLWGLITYNAYQMSQQPQQFAPDGSVVQTPTIGPDVGVYLFILGSVVLIFTGYHLFLQAAQRTSSPLAARPPATLVTLDSAATAQVSVAAAPDSADAAHTSEKSADPAAEPIGAMGQHRQESETSEHEPRVALPGSAAWHEAPQLPVYTRPSSLNGGWQRQPRTRR